MRYSVDATAIIALTIEAPSEEEARRHATAFVEGLSPQYGYILGWNSGLNDPRLGSLIAAGNFSLDGVGVEEQE